MSLLTTIHTRCMIALVSSVFFVAGCSSSDSGSSVVDSPSPVEDVVTSTNNLDGSASDTTDAGTGGGLDDVTDGVVTPTTVPVVEETSTGGQSVPDPLVQNLAVVDFDITVPAYMSDALQVRVVWGDFDVMAQWVGDEYWSAIADFPTNTQHPLVVTFSDDNGETTLGTVEQSFKTGSGDMEVFTVTADQFDTDRWDKDGDSISNLDEPGSGTDSSETPRVLLFSETRDYRHESIETALTAIEALSVSAAIDTIRAADSAGIFTAANLASYDAVIWVLTSGDVLDDNEQAAFEQYIQSGGGYAGIHAASDTEYEWPWYGRLVGAWFESHPEIQSATMDVENSTHQSTAHLSVRWTRTDEWYDYKSNPRAQVNVLLSLDEESYTGGAMGDDHPIAWYHDFDGGRAWYTGGGHTDASYAEPDFRAHLLGGLRYAAGIEN